MTAEVIPLWRSVAGGALIGVAAASLILFNGRVAGVSGILDELVHGRAGQHGWRLLFVIGLILPAVLLGTGTVSWSLSAPWLVISGVLVGLGTRLGSGCTSGHGVCGIANLSVRSLVATLTFIAVAIITVIARRALLPL
jgi:uncharacterized membrane protein YedE/YeeE